MTVFLVIVDARISIQSDITFYKQRIIYISGASGFLLYILPVSVLRSRMEGIPRSQETRMSRRIEKTLEID